MRRIIAIFIQLVLTVLIQKVRSQSDSTESSTSTTSTPIYYIDKTNFTWEPHLPEEVIIRCDPGYKIAVIINDCSIDGVNKEYATISSGRESETLMFTYKVSNTPSYFFNMNEVTAVFSGTNASNLAVVFSRTGNAFSKFSVWNPLMSIKFIRLKVQRNPQSLVLFQLIFGELPTTTTTELTSSTIYLPSPSINDSSELVVYLTGKQPSDYANKDTLNALKDLISQMAQEYCLFQNFDLVDAITLDNVKINEIIICTNQFDCDSCVEVRFAVPIHIRDDPDSLWSGYQLNSQHLRLMWDRYSLKYLSNDIKTCDKISMNTWVKWQIIIIAVCTILIFGILLLIRHFLMKIGRKAGREKLRMSINSTIFTKEDIHRTSLQPHYLQEIPALFDNAYPMHNPGLGSSNAAYENYEDEIPNMMKLEDSDLEESGV